MITVHLVLNAHIDPVWLWPWQAGVDEMLATCRSACERLDNHPDAIFTRGEAWGYRMIERLDPALFERIRRHVEAGQWEIVGGWWLQPDCNLPGGIGFEQQIALGRKYFLSRFGWFPDVAYNVDSFGHAATLPGFMRKNGQTRYVMMRPQEHEMSLPARMFHWRGASGDEGVTTFRIARNYATHTMTREHVMASLDDLPAGVSHTMCFVGVGDHGGGPTERQIAWCRENATAIAGCRLVFSSPKRFFDAVAAEGAQLPVVTGELQYHAVGCYSVTRAIKTAVRRAEHGLEQARIVASTNSPITQEHAARLEEAWEQVCFNHFHDTLGGTCTPTAYRQLEDQLGGANAVADDIQQTEFRKLVAQLAANELQQIVLFNASDRRFEGYALLSPWTGARWKPHWRVLDRDGAPVPYQLTHPDSVADPRPRVLLRVALGPAQLETLRIDREAAVEEQCPTIVSPARAEASRLSTADVTIDLDGDPLVQFAGSISLRPRVELREDPTDTWSHGVERIGGRVLETARWDKFEIVDRGPLLVSAIARGKVGQSQLSAEWRAYRGEPSAELVLRVDWRARQMVLKLALPLCSSLISHTDGIPGGVLCRHEQDREQPLRDFSLLHLSNAPNVGVVCPDVYAIEVGKEAVFLTLLRSPLMAHHDPAPAEAAPRAIVADQGTHEFRFRFVCGDPARVDWLEEQAAMLHRPLLAADFTKGMRQPGPL